MGAKISSALEIVGDLGITDQNKDIGRRSSSGRYHPSEKDVFAVRRMFLHVLPVELANIILEEAHYWPRAFLARNNVPKALYGEDSLATLCYLLCPPIPNTRELLDGEEIRRKIKRVRFRIESCDQGWGGEQNLKGPYEGSYTWFEASIYRGKSANINSKMNNGAATSFLNDAQISEYGLQRVPNPTDGTFIWHVQRNVRASHQLRTHRVVWKDVTDNSDSVDEDVNYTGRGKGEGFIESLRPGDRIAVFARAQYAAWVNHITSVQVEVFYSV